jgi:hypothetical protein
VKPAGGAQSRFRHSTAISPAILLARDGKLPRHVVAYLVMALALMRTMRGKRARTASYPLGAWPPSRIAFYMADTDVDGKPYWAAVGFHRLTNNVL